MYEMNQIDDDDHCVQSIWFQFEMTFGMYEGPFLIHLCARTQETLIIIALVLHSWKKECVLLCNTCYSLARSFVRSSVRLWDNLQHWDYFSISSFSHFCSPWTIGFLSFVVKYGQGQVIVTFRRTSQISFNEQINLMKKWQIKTLESANDFIESTVKVATNKSK